MKKQNINKLLVLIDGSRRSMQTAQYLADMPELKDTEIHLFHVFSKIPESHYDLAMEPASVAIGAQLMAWERGQRDRIDTHMEKCRKILLAADFHPGQIRIVVENRQRGIARDIAAKSRDGYDAVVLRRRGMSKLTSLIMGSVAFKLLNSVDSVPMIFAGRKPRNHRILVGMDPSQGAERAVDFIGRMVGGQDYEIGLASVFRNGSFRGAASVKNTGAAHPQDERESLMAAHFLTATDRLVAAGLDGKKIRKWVIRDELSRAGALLAAAEEGDYSTIVVGRKGVSRVSDFVIGRVSSKLLQIGRKHHVWIVS